MTKHNDSYRPKRLCPECNGALRIRDGWSKHELLHFEYVKCQNTECGAVYRVQREFTHIVSPSGQPNPNVKLPRAQASDLKSGMMVADANHAWNSTANNVGADSAFSPAPSDVVEVATPRKPSRA